MHSRQRCIFNPQTKWKTKNYCSHFSNWESEMKWKSLIMSDSATSWTVAHQAPLSLDSPGKNTRMGCHSLLEGIFLTQGSNPGLLHCRQILYHWATREVLESEAMWFFQDVTANNLPTGIRTWGSNQADSVSRKFPSDSDAASFDTKAQWLS